MKGIIAAVIWLFSAQLAWAENYDGIADRFFDKIAIQQYDQAVDSLGLDLNNKDTDLQPLKLGMSKLFKSNYTYHELVSSKAYGTRYVTLIYIVGTEKAPAGVLLKLYKPASKWTVHSMSFNTSFDELLKEKGQAN